MTSFFASVALRRFPLFLFLFAMTSALAEADTVDELIKQLSSSNQETRTEAAEQLRGLYAPPGRERWDALLEKTKPGDSKQDILKRFNVGKDQVEMGIGTGPQHMEQYRLDDRWMISGWFNNSDDTLREAKLVENVRSVWVKPTSNFSGVWISYFVNGQKSHEIHYRNGKKHGRFTSYHANGSRAVVQNYNSQVADGEDTGYYRTGEVSYRGTYSAGKQVGIWRWLEKDGSIRTEQDHGE